MARIAGAGRWPRAEMRAEDLIELVDYLEDLEIDVHPVVIDERGDGVYQLREGGTLLYPAEGSRASVQSAARLTQAALGSEERAGAGDGGARG